MVKLETNKKTLSTPVAFPSGILDEVDIKAERSTASEKIESEKKQDDGYKNELEEFSKEVLERLIEDNIATIPDNFSLYFDRLLDEKPAEFKKKIAQILELENTDESEKQMNLEKRMKESFIITKQILQIVGMMYKNLTLMNEIATKKSSEMGTVTNPVALQNILTTLTHDLNKVTDIVKKQTINIKELYHKNAGIVQEVENETIYDSQFGIYNKRYFLAQAQKEAKFISQFGHNSTIVTAKIATDIIKRIKSEKGALLVTRTISRLILKTSRRSDIIAHYGDGVFILLLKHSDLFSAKKACERLSELVNSTNFFLGESEIQLKISIGIAKLTSSKQIDEIIACAISAMEESDKVGSAYKICTGDE